MVDSIINLLGLYFVLSFLKRSPTQGSLEEVKDLLKETGLLFFMSFAIVTLSYLGAAFLKQWLKPEDWVLIFVLGLSYPAVVFLKKEATFMIALLTLCFLCFDQSQATWFINAIQLFWWLGGYVFFRFLFIGFKERLLFASPAKSFEGLPFYLFVMGLWIFVLVKFGQAFLN